MGESKRRKLLGLERPKEVKMSMVRCMDCEYWIKNEGEQDGVCHRYPPTPLLIPVQAAVLQKVDQPKVGLGMNFYFPRTRPEIPCGEGKLREQ